MIVMKRILIVESDFSLSEKLYRAFSSIETEVTNCSSMESATALLEDQIYNIAVIDTELSDGDGYDLIYEIELGIYNSKDVQVIVILPNDREPDMVELMERGITDYITKPFATAVLKAKILTILTRQKKRHALISGIRSDSKSMDNIINITDRSKTVIGNYVFDFEQGEFSVGGRKVILDEVQQLLLKTLINNKGVVLRKRALVDKLRSQSRVDFIDESVLSDMIEELTKRLCADNYIKTVYGIGYMWIRYDENMAIF
jgi:DNA-binding response OmpR family regulator